MNKLSIIDIEDDIYSETTYSGLAVDDVQLDDWLARFVDNPNEKLKVNTIKGLWFSLNIDLYSDTKLVWRYLGQLQQQAISYVPLLVCPDDVDLSCTVVVTEQQALNDKIVWKRFGFVLGKVEEQNSDAIEWLDNVPELIFNKDNFIEVFSEFKKEFTQVYRHQGEFIDIDFPVKQIN